MNLWFQRRPKVPIRTYFDEEIAYWAHQADLINAEMTIGVLPNPTGAGYFDTANYGNYHQQFEILSTYTPTPVPVGSLMEFVTPYTGPGTGAIPTLMNVTGSSTTADFLLAGPLVSGSTNLSSNASTSVPAGKVCTVLRLGIAQMLSDATTTAGHPAIQSAATAGVAKDSATAVASKTIGTWLQAVTISSGTGLVWASIALT